MTAIDKSKLDVLVWNVENANYNVNTALDAAEKARRTLDIWTDEIRRRRETRDRQVDKMVEFKRTHADPLNYEI